MNLSKKMLEAAENCLRDIRERVEHSGTSEKMMQSINKICDSYWKFRREQEKIHRIRDSIDESGGLSFDFECKHCNPDDGTGTHELGCPNRYKATRID